MLQSILAAAIISSAVMAAQTKRIEDNSFLIEEAYNQEDRVVQHVQTLQFLDDKSMGYSFTQEWPIGGRAHQLSATIALQNSQLSPEMGLGDTLLNYRYQLVDSDTVAASPRLSLVIPSGDFRRGLGKGAVGAQVNMPLSVELSSRFVMHWNLGVTFLPNAKANTGATDNTFSFNYGTSLVWLASSDLNVMMEFAGQTEEQVLGAGGKERVSSFIVNPGLRYAANLGELQMVPGLSAPVKFEANRTTYGVFAYLSLEHPY